MNNLVRNISLLAKENKISIRKLEMTLGFSDKLISSWEDHAPRVDKLVQVADYFGVSVDFLLGRESHSNAEETALIAKFRRLTPSQKETILNNIDFLLSQNPVKKESSISSR